MESNESAKRITLKHSRPNPLFQEWLECLHRDAVTTDSPLAPKLKEALESLSKYPLPLESGAACLILKGFDKKLCKFLDKQLQMHQDIPEVVSENVEPQSLNSSNKEVVIINGPRKTKSNASETESLPAPIISPEVSCSGPKKPKIRKTYKPAFRSGGYAILMALLENFKENAWENPNPSMKKEELILKAQQYSEESFTRPKPESFYTAWSNMSRLITKGLVNQVKGKKATYSLTDEGHSLAIEIFEETKDKPTLNDIIFNDNPSSDSSQSLSQPVSQLDNNHRLNELPASNDKLNYLSNGGNSKTSTQSTGGVSSIQSQSSVSSKTSQNSEPPSSSEEPVFIELPTGSFDIILLIDKAEASTGTSKKTDPTVAQFNKYPDLKHEYVSLKVGDFTWIARHKEQKNLQLVLPYVVERKRMDDLGKSIKDGRFHEQKFRLRKCGLNNVIYLAENYGSNKHVGLPLTSLMQALTNTRVHDGFKVHITDSHTNSARFLAMMTKRLIYEYKTDPTVAQFNKYPDLKHEYVSLKVGDFTWIARHKEQKNLQLVLPYVVERKRMDDLGKSIKDGRFHEQKFRLRKCGLNNVIYLAENYGSNKHVGLPLTSLMQALTNTRVHDGFKVHITDSHTNSARFLAMMTKRLIYEYKKSHLIGSNRDIQGEELMTFEYFNKSSIKSKPLTVTETFIKLLLQLRGVSIEKALAITKVYTTPKSLITTYEKCSKKEGETLLSNLKYGEFNRNVGPSVSKSIYQLFVWNG